MDKYVGLYIYIDACVYTCLNKYMSTFTHAFTYIFSYILQYMNTTFLRNRLPYPQHICKFIRLEHMKNTEAARFGWFVNELRKKILPSSNRTNSLIWQ